MRELQLRRGYQEISTPILVDKKLWQQSGHWDLYDANMFRLDVRGPRLRPEAHELPGVDVHLPLEDPVLSRPAASPQRVRPAAPQRAVGNAVRPDPGPAVHPGRRACLRPAGPACRRDRGDARRGSRGVLVGRPRAPLRVRHEARQGHRRSGPLGAGRSPSSRQPSTGPAATTRSSPRMGRSTRRRSTSTSTMPSAGSGRWRRSRRTSRCCRSAST